MVVMLCLFGLGRAQFNITCGPVLGSLYDFSLPDINGTTVHFKDYANQVVLIANVASF